MARSPAGPPPPDLPFSSSTSHPLDWPPPSALQSYIIGGLFGALLFAAGALLCHNGYRSLGRLSRRYGMTPIELLAVLRRHTPSTPELASPSRSCSLLTLAWPWS